MVSVKDLAESLSVTRQTVRNEMRRQGISPTESRDDHGRPCFMLEEEQAEKISAVIRKRQEIREEEKPSELERLKKEKAALEASNEYLAERYAENVDKTKSLEAEIEHLRVLLSGKEELLAAKEELIAAKEEQIRKEEEHVSELARTMENLSESLKASQVLAAGYQKRIEQLTAPRQTEQPNGDPEQGSAKKWWQFWK